MKAHTFPVDFILGFMSASAGTCGCFCHNILFIGVVVFVTYEDLIYHLSEALSIVFRAVSAFSFIFGLIF